MTYVIYDTESNGLPKNRDIGKFRDFNNMSTCRLIELAWQVRDNKTHKLLKEKSQLIKFSDFFIPPDTSNYNGITEEMVLKDGVELPDIITEFMEDIGKAKYLVGFNIVFDINLIHGEMLRYYKPGDVERTMRDYFQSIPKLCLQVVTNLNRPRLLMTNEQPGGMKDIYRHLFKEEYSAHRALSDVHATSRLYQEYLRLDLVKDIHFQYRHDHIVNLKFAHKRDQDWIQEVLKLPKKEPVPKRVIKKDPLKKKTKRVEITYGKEGYPNHIHHLEMLSDPRKRENYDDDYQNLKVKVSQKYRAECYWCGNLFGGCVRIDQLDGDMNNSDSETFVHSCFYCYGVRYFWKEQCIFVRSELSQVDIVKRMYDLYRKNGTEVTIDQIDPQSEKTDQGQAFELIEKGDKTIKAFCKLKQSKLHYLVK